MGQDHYCRLVNGLFSYFRLGFELKEYPWQGGGIAAGFAAKYPEMVDEKMILLAPAGLLKVRSSFYGVYCIDRQLLNRLPTPP
jgi:hypothetical protein